MKQNKKFRKKKRHAKNNSINFNDNKILLNIIHDMKTNPDLYKNIFSSWGIKENYVQNINGYDLMMMIRRKFVRDNVRVYESTQEEFERSFKIARYLHTYLGDFNMYKGKTYLDYGCNNGNITKSMSRFFNLDPTDVYGMDVLYWSGKKNDCGVNMIYRDIENPHIDVEDNFFDLITVFHTLHHCKHNDIIAKELVRILKPGGRLILREHNLDKEITTAYLDLEHLKFEVNENKGHELEEYYSHYRSEAEWYRIIDLPITLTYKEPNQRLKVFTTVFSK